MANYYGNDAGNTQLGGFDQYYGGAGEDYLKADININGDILYGGVGNDAIGTENATAPATSMPLVATAMTGCLADLNVDYLYGEVGNDFISGDDYNLDPAVGTSDYIEGGQGFRTGWSATAAMT